MAATTAQTHPKPLNPIAKPPRGPRPSLACFSFAAYAKTLIAHLRSLDIPILPGLTDLEFVSLESMFHFTFPPDLRSILREGLPLGPSFPNWRSSSPQQLRILLDLPFLSLSKNVALHDFWSESWGPKPQNNAEASSLIKNLYQKAPVLVPIYRNCYIPSTPNMAGNPVFYVDGDEVRVLSFDVARFFQEVEFLEVGGVVKPFLSKSNNVNVPAWAATAPRRIEFWTDTAEMGRRVVERGVSRGWWSSGGNMGAGLGACLEEAFWRLREGGWREEEVKEMMMMMDGCDDEMDGSGTQSIRNKDSASQHVRALSLVLLRAGWTKEDVVYSLDLDDDGDDDLLEFHAVMY